MKTKKKFISSALCFSCVVLLFITSCKKEESSPQLKDIDGNNYKIVTIGTQVWMAENLKTTKYNDGTPIPNVTERTEWEALTSDAFCWYDNELNNFGNTYGALYNWYAVNTNKLCPLGWHVPSDDEWTLLFDYAGGISNAGTKLKSSTGWFSGLNGTDDYGFKALPGGSRIFNYGYFFNNVERYGYWWSSTEIQSILAMGYYMGWGLENVTRVSYSKNDGLSVRCLKD